MCRVTACCLPHMAANKYASAIHGITLRSSDEPAVLREYIYIFKFSRTRSAETQLYFLAQE